MNKILFKISTTFTLIVVIMGSSVKAGDNHRGEIVIVYIDDEALTQVLQEQWPVSRKTMADILKSIAAKNPKVIGLTILFSEGSRDIVEDIYFVDTIRSMNNLVLSTIKAGKVEDVSMFERLEKAGLGKFNIGFIDDERDKNGYVVSGIYTKKGLKSSFPLQVLKIWEHKKFSELNSKGEFFIKLKCRSLVDVFRGISAAKFLRKEKTLDMTGKIVLLTVGENVMPFKKTTECGLRNYDEVLAYEIYSFINYK